MIKEAIVKIVNKEDLTYDEAYTVMNEIMSGETTPTQNAAFLAALSTKSARAETTDEIAGCAAAMRAHATTDKIFAFVKELRRDVKIPMVFMTYANVVFSYGAEKFMSTCCDIGIDGLILPDLPFEEKEEFQPLCKKYGVDLISLIAPTSENRIAMIAKEAEGFIYVVSSLGVTGMRSEIKTDLASNVKVIRENSDVPCAIGFGISTPEQAKKMANISDGAIVGSAIIKLLEQYGKDAPKYIGEYVKKMKLALLTN